MAVALVLALSGCGTTNRFAGPPIPYSADLTALQTSTAEASVSAAYWATVDEATRKTVRDKYITEKLMLTDIIFLGYVREVSSDKRNLDAATEGVQMTLGIAATMVGGAQAKENLAALITLVTGGKAIVDKNYFGDKAIDAFLSTMIAARKERFLPILKGMKASTTTYPLATAAKELNEYAMAGSPLQAAAIIQKEAEKRSDDANGAIKSFEASIVPDNPALSVDVKSTKLKLRQSLIKANLTPQMLTTALSTLGVDTKNLGHDQMFSALADQVENADTAERVKVVDEAFRKATILK